MRRFITIAVVLAVLGACTCSQNSTQWRGTIEEAGGITIVKNPKKPLYKETNFRLEEDLTIGEAAGEEEYMFSQLSSIAVDEGGNIYAADNKETILKVFDKNGKFLRTISREGQGPGEIGSLYRIQITAANELLVTDGRIQKKITKAYDPIPITESDKEFVRKNMPEEQKVEFSSHHAAFYGFFLDDEGRVFVKTWLESSDDISYRCDVFDPEGKYIAQIPLRLDPHVWKEGKIYAIEEDEEGFHQIKRYEVIWDLQY